MGETERVEDAESLTLHDCESEVETNDDGDSVTDDDKLPVRERVVVRERLIVTLEEDDCVSDTDEDIE